MDGREAVREAYQLHYQRLVAAVFGLTGDFAEAQDVVQETFTQALMKWRRFGRLDSPEAWLRTVALNLVRGRWRRRRIWDKLLHTGRVAPAAETMPGIEPSHVALVTAMQALPHPTREALVLYYIADLAVQDIAHHQDVAVGTVKARLSRGRTALAGLLDDSEPALKRG